MITPLPTKPLYHSTKKKGDTHDKYVNREYGVFGVFPVVRKRGNLLSKNWVAPHIFVYDY